MTLIVFKLFNEEKFQFLVFIDRLWVKIAGLRYRDIASGTHHGSGQRLALFLFLKAFLGKINQVDL